MSAFFRPRQLVFWQLNLASALTSLRAHTLRTALTVLGIIFGVGAVVGMLAIGAGAEQEALEVIDLLGVNNIIVRAKEVPEQELRQVREKSLGLNRRDQQDLRLALPGAVATAGRKRLYVRQWVPKPTGSEPRLIGVSASYTRLLNLRMVEGRWYSPAEEAGAEELCVLGSSARRALFGFGPAVGQHLKVNDTWLTVIGVVGSRLLPRSEFEGLTLQDVNRDVYVPLNTLVKRFPLDWRESELDDIYVQFERHVDVREAAVMAQRLMHRQHRGQDDFAVVVPEALLEQAQRTQHIFNLVMGAIAGISLLVGGIGIMNIMLATVLERTQEIGLRRSVGARTRDIFQQFVTEAVLIALVGGVLGVALGFGISESVRWVAGWRTIVTPGSVTIAFSVCFAVGVAFGSYPAYRAARLDPVRALHYE
ncbi:MAG: ABC transporter permease [Terriglobia bacterium]